MNPAEKRELSEKLAEKGIALDKAAEALKVSEQMLALYLTEDSYPVPRRIIDGLNNLLQ